MHVVSIYWYMYLNIPGNIADLQLEKIEKVFCDREITAKHVLYGLYSNCFWQYNYYVKWGPLY